MSWASAAPAVVTAVLVLVVPGGVVGWAAGLRGIPAWGASAPLSVTVVALAAVGADLAGVRWGAAPVVVATVVAAVVGWGVGRLLGTPVAADPRWLRGSAVSATVLGAGLCAGAVVAGVGSPDRVPQTYDAVFHLNVVQRALETGSVSSLRIGTLSSPERQSAFYPGAWHAVTALVAETGVSAVVAASAVSVALALVWPFGCLALVRQALGPRLPALVAGGLLAGAFGAAPFLLLSYGTVWPNALGTVLLPPVLAAMVSAVGLSRRPVAGRRRSAAVVLGAAPALGLAHPNVVVTAAVYAVPLTAVALAWGPWRGRSLRQSGIRWVAWLLGCLGLLWVVTRSSLLAVTRGTDWRAAESLAQAVGEGLVVAPRGLPVAAVAAALSLLGVASAALRPRLRWLLGCHVAVGALFVLAAGSDSALAQALTGPWYNDAFRLGALLPVTAVPLAALGVAELSDRVADRLPVRGPRRAPLVAAVAVLATTGLAGLQGATVGANAGVVQRWYGQAALAGPAEQRLFTELRDVVPAGAVIAGNPWNGSALAEAVGGREVLFPHLSGSWGSERTTVASSLVDVRTDPAACAAARALKVDYVLAGPSAFWRDDRRQRIYAGLDVSQAAGFEPVAHGGRLTLYKVPPCEEDRETTVHDTVTTRRKDP
ncbi:hypothetical protein SAMN05216199_1633 [Pedococcus cremeus]|uniref:Uncharacterized protein n=1 Tax=Pedococcus cremeus TaxID=587636 RepID=A0A1H9TIZ1_9MICO|nr:DUF6541 family protein [Pedococcus cremeus]SER97066.1 hypothetical protein SAMN05216199_1633 [Pedococcus cremeus]